MEAIPKVPMLCFELKISTESTHFGPKLKQYISEAYKESPDSYNNEVFQLESLRSAAVRPSIDPTGLGVINRYFCQLKAIQSRFPMAKGQPAAVPFVWKDMFANMTCTLADIRFEMACILYNIGALHTNLAQDEPRNTPESLKCACLHLQKAAWVFQHLREQYHQPSGVDVCEDIMRLFQEICCAQAQECIMEKSIQDSKKASVIGAIATQVMIFYHNSMAFLGPSTGHDNIHEIIGTKQYNAWYRYLSFKMSYIASITALYQGIHSEEQQKMGERVAYYQKAADKLAEARKLIKYVEPVEQTQEVLTFLNDVVEGKRKAAKNENEFIYHEEVPNQNLLTDMKAVCLIKAVPINFNDPVLAGADIFARLVPMGAHEASSMYSEEKAKLLRHVVSLTDAKTMELTEFMSSLQLDQLDVINSDQRIPQEIVDRCAAMNAKTDVIQILSNSMNNLAEIISDVEHSLEEIKIKIQEELTKEKEFQKLIGHRPPSIVQTELSREYNKYQEAHTRTNESNQVLHKAMTLHIANLRILALPLDELQNKIPSLDNIEGLDRETMKEMRRIVDKAKEMQSQRDALVQQLREEINNDDITSILLSRSTEPLSDIFKQELEKHTPKVKIIEQNLAAQENIINKLTSVYASYGESRRLLTDVLRKREALINALITSYDTHEELLGKSQKGLEFYKKLHHNITQLQSRLRSTCQVQEEERAQLQAPGNQSPVSTPAVSMSSDIPTSVSHTPKLRDYLPYMKNRSLSRPVASVVQESLPADIYYPESIYPTTARPAPVGSEATTDPGHGSYTDGYTVQADISNSMPQYNIPDNPYSIPSNYYPNNLKSNPQPLPEQQITNPYNPSIYNNPNYYANPQEIPPNEPQIPVNPLTASMEQYNYAASTASPVPTQYNTSIPDPLNYQNNLNESFSQMQLTNPEPNVYTNPTNYSTNIPYVYDNTQPPASQTSFTNPYSQSDINISLPQVVPNIPGYPQTSTENVPQFPPVSTQNISYMSQNVPNIPIPQMNIDYNQVYMQPDLVCNSMCNSNSSGLDPNYSYGNVNMYPGMNYPSYTASNVNETSYAAMPSGNSSMANQGIEATNYGVYNTLPEPNKNIPNINNENSITSHVTGHITNVSSYQTPQNYNENVATSVSNYTEVNNQTPQNYVYPDQGSVNYNQMGYQNHPGYTYNMNTGVYEYNYGSQNSYSNTSQDVPDNQNYNISHNGTYTNAGSYATVNSPSENQQVPQINEEKKETYYSSPYGYQTTNQTVPELCHSTTTDNFNYPNNQSTYIQSGQIQDTSVTYSSKSNNQVSSPVETVPQAPTFTPNAESPTSELPQVIPQTTPKANTVSDDNQTVPDVKPEPVSDIKEPSAFDLLSEIDFSVEQKPLMPEIKVPQISENAIKKFLPETVETVKSVPKVEDILERPAKMDLFSDPTLMNKFTQEVKNLQKLVDSFTNKSAGGLTVLDNKWKNLQEIQTQENMSRTKNVAMKYSDGNIVTDVVPFDDSRLILKSNPEAYINASYYKQLAPWCIPLIISSTPSEKDYAIFWKAVLENKVNCLVCLLSEIEVQGNSYWPTAKGQTLEFGGVRVTLEDVICKVHWTERKIVVAAGKNLLKLTHYQISVFPAKIACSPLVLLADKILMSTYENKLSNQLNCAWIHDNLGAGRAAVVSLLLMIMCQVRAGQLDLCDMLETGCGNLLRNRANVLEDTKFLADAYRTALFYVQGVLCSGTTLFNGETVSAPSGASVLPPMTPNISTSQTSQTDLKPHQKFSRESFEEMKQSPGLTSGDMKDPLNFLDPLWSLKKK